VGLCEKGVADYKSEDFAMSLQQQQLLNNHEDFIRCILLYYISHNMRYEVVL